MNWMKYDIHLTKFYVSIINYKVEPDKRSVENIIISSFNKSFHVILMLSIVKHQNINGISLTH